MGCLGFHQFGTFLLFIAFILLLVSTISAPVVHNLSLLKVSNSAQELRFGALGYCQIVNNADDSCSAVGIGYAITNLLNTDFTDRANEALDTTTKALILHPIATGLSFLAFALAAVSHRFGYIFSALLAALTFFFVLATLIVDIVIFGVSKRRVESNSSTATAVYGPAFWCTVAAFVLLFIGSISTCFSCFTDRRQKRGNGAGKW